MKKLLCVLGLCVIFILGYAIDAHAHELYIQIEEDLDNNELKIEIIWGHIRDFVDQANHENYELFARYPNGEIIALELEQVGVFARSYLPISGNGEYIFWANRKPSVYSPSADESILSVQMAKAVYHVGKGSSSDNPLVDLTLEILPQENLGDFGDGEFQGYVLFDGSPAPSGTIVNAYGPQKEILEAKTDDSGAFSLTLNSHGLWLLKANVRTKEEGELNDTHYQEISRTSTLVFDTSSSAKNSSSPSVAMVLILLFTGVLLGSSGTFLIISKK